MGKPLKSQRRGKGLPRYRCPKSQRVTDLAYRSYDDIEKAGVLKGEILYFVDDPARNAVLMKVKYDNNEQVFLLAPEGIAIGDFIEAGAQGKIIPGSVLPLYRVPDGAYVYNIENRPGDGGKFVKSPGSYAVVVSKEKGKVFVRLPSKKTIQISEECRVQIGVIAGGGRLEKPLLKAGNAHYKYRVAKHKLWPTLRGVHMSAYNHPHGGKQHHVGKPTTVARGAPPGSKVGHIAARATGRKKSRIVNEATNS
ncbi:MAG: 50S ribosomal protein L2 [Candidatus Micrarchaeota archaeon]